MASTLTSRSTVPSVDDRLDPTRHPRPLLRRRDWASLDGTWQFRYGSGPAGSGDDGAYPLEIRVPFAPESPASGLGDDGYHPVVGYRRTLEVPESWRDRRIVLRFGAVDREAEAWVNGHHVARHDGGYTPFSADVTHALRFDGRDVLEVRAEDDPHDMGAPRGKQDWARTPHSIWYPRTTGIWQTVWMEAVPETHVEAVHTVADLGAFALDLAVDFGGVAHATSVDAGLTLQVTVRRGDDLVCDDHVAVTGPRLRRRIHLPDPGIDDAREAWLWTPERPTLLDLTLRLTFGGELLDEVRSYAAMRTVEVDEGAFVLNGRPYPLRLVLDQGYWPDGHLTAPSAEALRRDVELTKALGFNGVRKHQKLEDPRYLAWADRLGLLVWTEIPSAYAFGPRTLERLAGTLTGAIRRDAGHPSVVAWVVANESWGFPDLPRRPEQRHAIQALTHLAKALDPTRPVVGNDGWEVVCGDLVNVHDYAADPEVLRYRYADRERLARHLPALRPAGRRLLFEADVAAADPRTVGRPVLLTEFGGVRVERLDPPVDAAVAGEAPDGSGAPPRTVPADGADGAAPAWGYADVDDAAAFLERYEALLAAVHASEVLAGFCYTQFTDTFQEQNGLLTMDRRPKADPEALARATRGRGGRRS